MRRFHYDLTWANLMYTNLLSFLNDLVKQPSRGFLRSLTQEPIPAVVFDAICHNGSVLIQVLLQNSVDHVLSVLPQKACQALHDLPCVIFPKSAVFQFQIPLDSISSSSNRF